MKKGIMFSLTIFLVLITLNAVSAADRNVGPGYTYANITDAINSASSGDTINVYDNGGAAYTYIENVEVNKTNLTIISKGNVTVKAKYSDSPVFLITFRGNGSSISNFKITGATGQFAYGIHFRGLCSNVTIKNNTIYDNDYGIRIMESAHNSIINNTIYNNHNGIWIQIDSYTTISGNTIENNTHITPEGTYGTGIISEASNHLTVTGNTIKNSLRGIFVDGGPYVTISNNNLVNNKVGIYMLDNANCLVTGNKISTSTTGILLETLSPKYLCRNNTITQNTIQNCTGYGISIHGASQNLISKNTLNNNNGGIVIDDSVSDLYDGSSYKFPSSNNTVLANNIFNNGNGITFASIFTNSSGNHVNYNRIVNNTVWGLVNYSNENVDARYNWWGSNSNPSGKIYGTPVTYNPWLVLKISSASSIIAKGTKTTITADLTQDSNGIYHNPVNGHILDGISLKFATTLGTITSMASTVNGVAKATLTGGSTSGIATISASLDNATVKTSVTIDNVAPKVTSTNPKSGAIRVSRTSTIFIRFSENIKASSYWSRIYIKNLKTGRVVSFRKWISGNTLYLKMTYRRYAYTWYKVYIPSGAVKDALGNNGLGYSFTFKTGRY